MGHGTKIRRSMVWGSSMTQQTCTPSTLPSPRTSSVAVAAGFAAALLALACHPERPPEAVGPATNATASAAASPEQPSSEPGAGAAAVSPSDPARYLEMRNVSVFEAADQQTHAVGEIFNLGSEAVAKPSAVIALRDPAGKPIEQGQCVPLARILPGHEDAPCQVSFKTRQPRSTHDSSLRAVDRAKCEGCFLADVHATDVSFKLAPTAGAPHRLTGRFQNKSPVEAVGTAAVGVLYDADGRLLAVGETRIGSGTVASGAQEPFELVFEHYFGSPKRYVVTPLGYLPGPSRLAKACEGQFWRGCYVLGRMHADGNGVDKDLEKAAELYRRACDGGYTYACFRLGTALAKGEGVAKDPGRALGLFTAACDKKDAAGCNGVGEAHEKGWGTAASRTKALQWYDQACSLGETAGCQNAERLRSE